MLISILTFEGFNEIDSLVPFGILNRIKKPDWHVHICSPTPTVTSMNGVTIQAQSDLSETRLADVVIVGSGLQTRNIVQDAAIMSQLQLDPARQLIAAQCSGTLVLAKLGLLGSVPACTDLISKPWVVEAGVNIVNEAFYANGNVATAGGCLATQYLSAWVIAKTEGLAAAREALHYVAPVGEKDEYVARAIKNIQQFIPS